MRIVAKTILAAVASLPMTMAFAILDVAIIGAAILRAVFTRFLPRPVVALVRTRARIWTRIWTRILARVMETVIAPTRMAWQIGSGFVVPGLLVARGFLTRIVLTRGAILIIAARSRCGGVKIATLRTGWAARRLRIVAASFEAARIITALRTRTSLATAGIVTTGIETARIIALGRLLIAAHELLP